MFCTKKKSEVPPALILMAGIFTVGAVSLIGSGMAGSCKDKVKHCHCHRHKRKSQLDIQSLAENIKDAVCREYERLT